MTRQHPPTFRHRLFIWGLTALIALGGLLFHQWWTRYPEVSWSVDGKTITARVSEKSVKELLQSKNIVLSPLDLIDIPLESPIEPGLSIHITRVRKEEETTTQEAPVRVQWRVQTRQNLRRVRLERGVLTRQHKTMRRTYHDGALVEEQMVQQKQQRKPFYRLSLVNDENQVEKTYDLFNAPKYSMLATAYYVGDPMVPSDTTYMGHKLERGLVAVDPSVIPLGWRLYIPGYGYAYSSDTGSAIKGMRIDLAVKDRKEELRYNHRQVTIYLLEKAKSW